MKASSLHIFLFHFRTIPQKKRGFPGAKSYSAHHLITDLQQKESLRSTSRSFTFISNKVQLIWEMDSSRDGCTMSVYLMPPDYTLKNGLKAKCYVLYILPQFLKIRKE